MNERKLFLLALERLRQDPQTASLVTPIMICLIELQNEIITLQDTITSRSREDNFQKASDLIEARIDQIILSNFETL